jgi:hypothetical protein
MLTELCFLFVLKSNFEHLMFSVLVQVRAARRAYLSVTTNVLDRSSGRISHPDTPPESRRVLQ